MHTTKENAIGWWQPVLFCALAGGMAWGIRGQYGHETGAMIAGLLVTSVIVFLLCPRGPMLPVVRAIALGTVAMGFGGSMTYGQTLGLTQNPEVLGNWFALGWGLLGTAIKGSLWIGLAGAFIGMGLGGKRYRAGEMLGLMLAMIAAGMVGLYLFNSPFDPENRLLPFLYFSEHWFWAPDKAVFKPRPEWWGALLMALIVLMFYTGRLKGDRFARNLALWGMLGGALGFPTGQALQAFHAWNPALFQEGFLANATAHFNWWNMMETTFGAIMGAALGLGAWRNRALINPAGDAGCDYIPLPIEISLLGVHLVLLTLVEFAAIPAVDMLYDLGLMMGVLPMMLIVGGRFFAWLQIFPLILLPIAGKTVKELVYTHELIGHLAGWTVYFFIPIGIATVIAVRYCRLADTSRNAHTFISVALLFNAWCYFLINFAFFRFPFPWTEWTARTPNALIFTGCILGITAMVAMNHRILTPRNH